MVLKKSSGAYDHDPKSLKINYICPPRIMKKKLARDILASSFQFALNLFLGTSTDMYAYSFFGKNQITVKNSFLLKERLPDLLHHPHETIYLLKIFKENKKEFSLKTLAET